MRYLLRKLETTTLRLAALALCLCVCGAAALAQSTDLSAPSPVTGPQINGVISPLDIGDSRLTRHFYTFGGGQGDVELTVDSNNLEGDIDLFASAGLRPLVKIPLYPGLNSGIARTVYLRRAETLILRVQARSPNDTDGSYRIRLGGSFVPAVAAAATETDTGAQSAATDAARGTERKGRRVSSVGARIEEPRVEVAVEFDKPSTPEPTPEVAAPTPRPTPARRATRTRPAARTPARTESASRGTSRGASRTQPATAAPESGEGAGTTTETEKPAPTESAGARPANNTRGGRTSRANRTRPAPASAAPAPAATGLELPGTRLVLELREGGQYVREMSEVRRVSVEHGLVIVLLKTGRVERHPLSNVLRMSIEP